MEELGKALTNRSQTVDHGTTPPLSATVPFMLSEWGENETFTIQTPGK